MRRPCSSALVLTFSLCLPSIGMAQGDSVRTVAGGGITVPGWMGKPDAGAVSEAKLAKEGDALVVTTGPAITYGNPANRASGDYTVKATFSEPKYMNVN